MLQRPPGNMAPIPAIDSIEDLAQARVVLYQSGQIIHTSLLDLVQRILSAAEGDLLLLEGDAQATAFDGVLLEGDAQNTGYDLLIIN